MTDRTDPGSRPTTRRSHPSAGARAVALVSSIAATGGVAAALAWADGPATTATTTVAAASATGGVPIAGTAAPTASTPPSTQAAARAAATTTTARTASSKLTDGTWTGAVESFRFGSIQVAAIVKGGKVVDVRVLQEPADGKSQRINASATPILEGEAVAEQSADIHAVSGATLTSRAYRTSLQAALDAAAKRAS